MSRQVSDADEEQVARERQKARELKASRWWQNKIANVSTCYYCSISLKKSEVTMDHVLPIIRGGLTSKSNVVISCRPCNQKKANLSPVEWDEFLQRLTGKSDNTNGPV